MILRIYSKNCIRVENYAEKENIKIFKHFVRSYSNAHWLKLL